MNGRAITPGRSTRPRRWLWLRVAVIAASLAGCGLSMAAERTASHGFALYTDAALMDAVGGWESLDPAARRELLTELRLRHIAGLQSRSEHRFGYRLRGSHLHDITVRRSGAIRIKPASAPFGAGFERRHGAASTVAEPIDGVVQPDREAAPR